MNRREFLQSASVGLALSTAARAVPEGKRRRVGLIGCGWYGKIDLLRLIQIAPVEMVSLCDVDKKMLAQAANIVAARQLSKKTPRTYGDYRKCLREGSRPGADRAAGPLARADHDRGGKIGPGRVGSRSLSAWTCWKAERWWRRHTGMAALCRWACSVAAHRTLSKRKSGSSIRQIGKDRAGRDLLLLPYACNPESAETDRRHISITRCGPARRLCALITP